MEIGQPFYPKAYKAPLKSCSENKINLFHLVYLEDPHLHWVISIQVEVDLTQMECHLDLTWPVWIIFLVITKPQTENTKWLLNNSTNTLNSIMLFSLNFILFIYKIFKKRKMNLAKVLGFFFVMTFAMGLRINSH